MEDFKEKTFIVTGAAQGIGKAIAKAVLEVSNQFIIVHKLYVIETSFLRLLAIRKAAE